MNNHQIFSPLQSLDCNWNNFVPELVATKHIIITIVDPTAVKKTDSFLQPILITTGLRICFEVGGRCSDTYHNPMEP